MFDQPSWLNLEEVLYPQTLMSKLLIIQSHSAPVHNEYQVSVIYNSYHREIDITEVVNNAIMFAINGKFRVQIFNFEEEKYQILGLYPFAQPLLLKGCFIQFSVLKLKVFDLDIQSKGMLQSTKRKEKIIKDIVKVVAQWRKNYLSKQKKITLEEAAIEIGIPKNTLDDYYYFLKTAQKYGFDFQNNLDKPFKILRKFVQENNEKKSKDIAPVMAILEKYHPK